VACPNLFGQQAPYLRINASKNSHAQSDFGRATHTIDPIREIATARFNPALPDFGGLRNDDFFAGLIPIILTEQVVGQAPSKAGLKARRGLTPSLQEIVKSLQDWGCPGLVDTVVSIINSFFKVNRTDIAKG
jgi:hypothetical protein